MKHRPHSRSSRAKWLLALAAVVVLVATMRVLLSPSRPEPSEPDETAIVRGEAESEESRRGASVDTSGASTGMAREIEETSGELPHGRPLAEEALVLDDAFVRALATIEDPSGTYAERGAVVRGLGTNLSPFEIEALYRFLLAAPPDTEEERVLDRAVKNDLLNLLRNQDNPPEDLTGVMMDLFGDSDQDAAVRDYALQHMGVWHESASDEEKGRILDAFKAALDERATSLAGTALIGLNHLTASGSPDETSGLNVAEAALAIVRDETAGDLARVTALNLAAGSASAQTRDSAAEWALDPAAGYPLRLASIAALGSDGSPEAIRVLERVAALGDPHLAPAIARANRNLETTGSRPVNATQP